MTPRDPARRRFLTAVAAALGAVLAAPLAWARYRTAASPTTTTLGAASTTVPPSGTSPTTTVTNGPPVMSTESPASTTTQAPTTTTQAPTTTTTVGPVPLQIQAICVAGWGGEPPQGEFVAHAIERLTIHHTASLLETNTEAPNFVRGHQRFHQRDREWPDLAYHFIVDRNGHVYEGRPLWARGDSATSYDPTGHFLVSCEGDFDDQEPSDAQLQALVAMLAWAAAEFGVSPSTMRGHRDLAATSCPGKHLYPLLTDGTLLAGVNEALAAGPPQLSLLCGDDARVRVADIESGVI